MTNAIQLTTQRYTHTKGLIAFDDLIAVESPMQIKLRTEGEAPIDYAVLMRTPGEDRDLITGLLFSESVIHAPNDILQVQHIKETSEIDEYIVTLRDKTMMQELVKRNIAGHSGCGLCATDSAERLLQETYPVLPLKSGCLKPADLLQYRRYFLQGQTLFSRTGGSHATILLDREGKVQLLKEDVGRHNAMDKAIGHCLQNTRLREIHLALVSGRLSFEIVHKALKAGIGLLAGLGAPSSMAVELAYQNNLTLIGFLHNTKFNVYTHPLRLTKD